MHHVRPVFSSAALALLWSVAALAQPLSPGTSTPTYCWIDAATGRRIPTLPVGPGGQAQLNRADPRRSRDAGTGTDYVTSDGGETWKNARTGKPVDTLPVAPKAIPVAVVRADVADPTHAHDADTGRTFVRVLCPPSIQRADAYLGGELLENVGRVRATYTDGGIVFPPGVAQFDDSGGRLGFGVVGGDNLALSHHRIVVGPFVSLDVLNQTINHTFAPSAVFSGNSVLSTTTHWHVLAGAKVGVVTHDQLFVYGLGGIRWLNQDLVQNGFGGVTNGVPNVTTSSRTTTRGYALGGGVELRPRAWAREHIAVFAQYQYVGWQNASLTFPAASPTFYAFDRSDETIVLGADVHFP